MSTPHQVRLYLFHAAEVPKTVILRRGPRRLNRLILWHRDEGRFEDGQWIKADVAPDRCALSPDARHFIAPVFVGGHSARPIRLYTTLCHPPYWTSLSLFLAHAVWDGGGAFHGNAHYEVYTKEPSEDIYANDSGLTRVFATRKGYVLRDHTPVAPPASPPPPLLADIVADGGKLLRIMGGEAQLIRDFSDMVFEPVVSPYAANVGNRKAWHPLDADGPPCP
jgi:hypothetical protein